MNDNLVTPVDTTLPSSTQNDTLNIITNTPSYHMNDNLVTPADAILPIPTQKIKIKIITRKTVTTSRPLFNRGTGAGGANTNLYGKRFEEKTNNLSRLVNDGYSKYVFHKSYTKSSNNFYYTKTFPDKTITFVTQQAFKKYIITKYNISPPLYPDEAYIIHYNNGPIVIRILEKKEQHVEGSVETKILAGPALKKQCQLVFGNRFQVHYAYCLNDFLYRRFHSNCRTFQTIPEQFQEANIPVFSGDETSYFTQLDAWINSSL